MTRGDELFRQAEFEQARRLYESDRRAGDRTHAVLQLARIALLENRLADVASELSDIEMDGSDAQTAHRLLAEALRRQDRFGETAAHEEALGEAARAERSRALAERSPYAVSGAASAAVSFSRVDPLPVFELRINGRAATFFLDTGGWEIILDAEFAEKAGVRTFGSVTGRFAGGLQADLRMGIAESVELGDMRVVAVPVHVKPMREAAQILGCRIDGVLGTVFLYHFLATIHYADAVLILEPRNATPEGGATVPFWLHGQHFILTRGTLNGVGPLVFHVDTGMAGGGFMCGRHTLDQVGIPIDEGRAEEGIGGGGPVRVVPFGVERIGLGPVERGPIRAMCGEAIPPEIAGIALAGVVSHEFFRPGFLTIDAARMELRIG
jgi:hypothetical protein